MTTFDFFDPSYLARGNDRQRRAYSALQQTGVLRKLSRYTPIVVGSLPLGIDLSGSDLDIACCAPDAPLFARELHHHFGSFREFRCSSKLFARIDSIVCNFRAASFEVEIFGQPGPVTDQDSYVHLCVEDALLELGGGEAIRAIREFKQSGLKTEPAFAAHFKIEGNPYQQLLLLRGLKGNALHTGLANLRSQNP